MWEADAAGQVRSAIRRSRAAAARGVDRRDKHHKGGGGGRAIVSSNNWSEVVLPISTVIVVKRAKMTSHTPQFEPPPGHKA